MVQCDRTLPSSRAANLNTKQDVCFPLRAAVRATGQRTRGQRTRKPWRFSTATTGEANGPRSGATAYANCVPQSPCGRRCLPEHLNIFPVDALELRCPMGASRRVPKKCGGMLTQGTRCVNTYKRPARLGRARRVRVPGCQTAASAEAVAWACAGHSGRLAAR